LKEDATSAALEKSPAAANPFLVQNIYSFHSLFFLDMLRLVYAFSLVLFATTLWAQDRPVDTSLKKAEDEGVRPDVTTFSKTITSEDLRTYLTYLASDELEGRETGQPGQQKAADYLAQQLASFGIPPVMEDGTYFQEIAYTAESWETIGLQVNGSDYRHLRDFYSFPATNTDQPNQTFREVVFLGYGIDDENYSDYAGQNVTGKVVLVFPGEPYTTDDSTSFITGTQDPSKWTLDFRNKLKAAHDNGAAAILLMDFNIKQNIAEQRRFLLSPRMRIGRGEEPEGKYANNLFISSTLAETIMGKRYKKVLKARDKIRKKGKSKSVTLKTEITLLQDKKTRQLIGSNVLGYIEGTDPRVKNEVVIVTAHYDHLGKRGEDIYNGADDNGSGTSTVLEVAQALAKAKEMGVGPARSVLCMLVSGEEKGLLGSKYYVNNPVFPLEQTVADVNVDMVGRVDQEHADNPNYIYVIGSDRLSTELHEINEKANAQYTQLELDYTYNAEDDPNRYYYRSDHYNFAERGIPSIFYFNGTHADYHRTSDTVEKINFDKMETIGQLVFHVVWELANRPDRIQVDVKSEE
jgi:hypothetical protein